MIRMQVKPQRRRGGAGRAVVPGAMLLCALAMMSGAAEPARAQPLDQSVAAALTGNCAAIGPAKGPNLTALCSGGPPSGGVNTPGDNATGAQSDVGGQDQESKIRKRLRDLREASGNGGSESKPTDTIFTLGGLSGFVAFDYENVDKQTTGFTPGFNSDKYGGTVGLDYSFGKFVLGAAFVLSRTNGDFSSNGGDFSTDSYGGYLYASATPATNFYLDAIAGYARKDMDLNRNVAFSNAVNTVTASGTAKSSTNGNEYKLGLSGGYDFTVDNLTFGPRLGVNYTHNTVGAFSESGSTGLELAFDPQSFSSLTSSVGMHGSVAISTSFGVLVPQASFDYIHEFLDSQKTFTAHFVEDLNASPLQLSFQNDIPDRNYFGLGIGMVAVLPNGISPYVNYRALVGDSIRTTQTATLGLRLEF
jgi:outer membrane autotransporter protein